MGQPHSLAASCPTGGASPRRSSQPAKTGHFYSATNRTFLLGVDKKFLPDGSRGGGRSVPTACFSRDLRFGHPATGRVLQSAARVQDIRSPLTIDAPFAPVSVAECRSIAVFQLAGGLFADTAPSSSLFSNQRLLSVAARRPLTAWHRQRPDPPQHVAKQPPFRCPSASSNQ